MMLGVVVEAGKAGVKLGHACLFGIESDSATHYFKDVAVELAAEAVLDAKRTLSELLDQPRYLCPSCGQMDAVRVDDEIQHCDACEAVAPFAVDPQEAKA